MNHASLFTGIGGFDLASKWMGWNNVFGVECDKYCCESLNLNFPDLKIYGDIRKFDSTPYRGAIDVVSGGFPCQPFSIAGKRKGDRDTRFLWPEMLRVICEIQPRYIVAENVRGFITIEKGRLLEQTCLDMEDQGYSVQPIVLPACAFGAPHRRDRVFILAENTNFKTNGGKKAIGNKDIDWNTCTTNSNINSNAKGNRFKGGLHSTKESPERILSKFYSRHYATKYWQNHKAKSPICGVDDGVSRRMDRLRALGNAVVPQVAYYLFNKLIND